MKKIALAFVLEMVLAVEIAATIGIAFTGNPLGLVLDMAAGYIGGTVVMLRAIGRYYAAR